MQHTFYHNVTDITELHAMIAELATDPTWGGLSPAGIRFHARRVPSIGYAVILADMDYLHEANDRFGHASVDERKRRVMARHRSDDVTYGRVDFGDEEVIFVPMSDALGLAGRLLSDLRSEGLSATFAVVPFDGDFAAAVHAGMARIEQAKRDNARGDVYEVTQ